MNVGWGFLLCAGSALLGAGLAAHLLARREQARRPGDAKLRDAERLAFLGTMTSGLAHELRNPLSTLRMHLQLLAEEWARPVSEREQTSARRLQGILKEVERLEGVLNSFMRFVSEHRLQREPTDLNKMIQELCDFVRPRASSIRMDCRLSPTLSRPEVDPSLIRQALLNLIINACEATPPGGTVTLSTEQTKSEVRVRVSDTGPGIPPDIRARIFQVYFSTKPSGAGLGLPTALRIVDEHQGSIEVESEPGRGATFTVILPWVTPHA
jgi:signal transduction histidine kinase